MKGRRSFVKRGRRTLTALSAIGSAIVLTSSAGASPSWGPVIHLAPPVSADAQAFGPRVALDPGGDAVVVWDLEIPGRCQGQCTYVVQAVSRQAGSEAWSAPVDLSVSGGPGNPDVALDSAGNAIAVFFKRDIIQAAYRPGASGVWQTPVTLSTDGHGSVPRLAVNAAGDAVASWSGPGLVPKAAFRPAATGVWETPVALSSDGIGPSVALDDAGNAVAVWRSPRPGNDVIQAASRPTASGMWEPPVDLAERAAVLGFEQVAVGAAGDAVAAWIGPSIVQAAYRPARGGWGAPAVISTPASSASDLRLAVDRAGNALAVWSEGSRVRSAWRPVSSGRWLPAVDVSAQEESASFVASFVDLAIDPAGNAVAVWNRYYVGEPGLIRAALRPAASGVWQAAVDVSPLRAGLFFPQLAMDASGGAFAVWGRDENRRRLVEGSELRGTGPVLEKVSIPSSGTVRVPARFGVKAVPWASPLAGLPTWSFGDGGSAAGAAVMHIYTRPGDYTVSVTQADMAGDSSTSTATITIAAPTLANTKRPSIRGIAQVGRTLICLTGTWTGTPTIRYTFRWLRNSSAIRGARLFRYRIRPGDAGVRIACRVEAMNAAGSARATSRAVRVGR